MLNKLNCKDVISMLVLFSEMFSRVFGLHVMDVYQVCAWCPRRSEKGVKSAGTGVRDGCGVIMVAENQTQMLSKSSKCSQSLTHLSSPSWVFKVLVTCCNDIKGKFSVHYIQT